MVFIWQRKIAYDVVTSLMHDIIYIIVATTKYLKLAYPYNKVY